MIDVQLNVGWLGIALTAILAVIWFFVPISDKLTDREIKQKAWLHSLYGLISIETLWIALLIIARVKGI